MDRFKQFITHLIIALGGVVFLTSTTCAEQFEPDPVEYEITVVNDSKETIYTILRIFRSPYAEDGLGGWGYPQPPKPSGGFTLAYRIIPERVFQTLMDRMGI